MGQWTDHREQHNLDLTFHFQVIHRDLFFSNAEEFKIVIYCLLQNNKYKIQNQGWENWAVRLSVQDEYKTGKRKYKTIKAKSRERENAWWMKSMYTKTQCGMARHGTRQHETTRHSTEQDSMRRQGMRQHGTARNETAQGDITQQRTRQHGTAREGRDSTPRLRDMPCHATHDCTDQSNLLNDTMYWTSNEQLTA